MICTEFATQLLDLVKNMLQENQIQDKDYHH